MAPAPNQHRFAWAVVAVGAWILGGLYLDGWSHLNGPPLESFFTPWHGVMYSGVLAAVWLLLDQVQRRRHAGLTPVPPGYGLSIVGGALFLAAAAADLVWHEALGIEVGVEALLSPPHLALGAAGLLVFAGPLRAARLAVAGRASDVGAWPAVWSGAQVLGLLVFFTQYANPSVQRFAALPATVEAQVGATSTDARQALGIAALIVAAALLAGVLVAVGRIGLPTGAVSAIVLGHLLLAVALRGTWAFVPAGIAAGVLGDVAARRWGVRGAATVAPAVLHAGSFTALAATGSLTWSIELVTGGVVLAGAAGALLAAVAAPVRDHLAVGALAGPAVPDGPVASVAQVSGRTEAAAQPEPALR